VFAGVRLLAAGGNVQRRPTPWRNPQHALERGNQRFENERCSLTAAGMSNYLAGQHNNLLVWALEFRCGGVNT